MGPASSLPSLGPPIGCYRLLITDLVLPFVIGVLPEEQAGAQRVRISLEADVTEPPGGFQEDIGRVVSYAALVDGIKALSVGPPIALVETLADRIAAQTLADERVLAVRVRVEKPDIIAEAAAVGVLIERRRAAPVGA